MDWHNEQTVPGEWEKRTLVVFQRAIMNYLDALAPHKKEGNNKINKEYDDWQAILSRIAREIKDLQDDIEEGKLPLLGKNYGKLFDIIWEHHSAKKQLLDEEKRVTTSEAALEGQSKEVAEIHRVLEFDFWNHVTRHKTLDVNFYMKEEEKEEPSVATKITIGSIYGQFAVINKGTMVQNNNLEAMQALREVTDAIVSSKLPDQEKQEVLLDVESMQSQLKKEKPNKKLLGIGFKSLQVAANVAQITAVVAPHMDKIRKFIEGLPIS